MTKTAGPCKRAAQSRGARDRVLFAKLRRSASVLLIATPAAAHAVGITLFIENGESVLDPADWTYLDATHWNAVADRAVVRNPGSLWGNQRLIVGDTGTGSLLVDNAGTVQSNYGTVGYNEGGVGDATVSGTGSTWRASESLAIGASGAGTLNILAGGSVQSTFSASIGTRSRALGQVSVVGPDSNWTSGHFGVGYEGTGSIDVSGGASLTSTRGGELGTWAGGIGTITLTGPGSRLDSGGSFTVGYGGAGALGVRDGANVDITGSVLIGQSGGGDGSVTVSGTGSTLDASGGAMVGNRGRGRLSVTTGGVASAQGDTYVAFYGGASGTVDVSGPGAQWNTGGSLDIGYRGNGSVRVQAGGAVRSGGVRLGSDDTGSGRVTIDGPGSTWTSANFAVGSQGTASLSITGGATVDSRSGSVGSASGLSNWVSVTGAGSMWRTEFDLSISGAQGGNSSLTVADGATVDANSSTLLGSAFVSGADSLWNNRNSITVGAYGEGRLRVENGGTLRSGTGYVGGTSSSNGYVTITGADSLWETGDLFVAGGQSWSGGPGSLDVRDGARVEVADTLTIRANGAVSIENATLRANTVAHTDGGTFTLGSGGTLMAVEFLGDLYNLGGTYAPGASPAASSVSGDYTQGAGAALQMEIGGIGPGDFDTLSVGGDAYLAGALEVVWYDGFSASVGDRFDLFDWGGAIWGAFDDVLLADLANTAWTWDVSQLYTTGVVSVEYAAPSEASPLPAPTTLALFATALAAFAARRRTAA